MLYRVDMNCLTVRKDEVLEYLKLGGGILAAHVVRHEVQSDRDLFGADNKLVIAPGLLAGTDFLYTGRLSLCTISPFSGMLKESNVGGEMGNKLGRLNIRAIIVQGQPHQNATYILQISAEGIVIMEMPDLKGCTIPVTMMKLRAVFGEKAAIGCLGPAGEWKMFSSCVAFTDMEGESGHYAGSSGFAAVMGSKGIKAIIVDDTGVKDRRIADLSTFQKAVARITAFTKLTVAVAGGCSQCSKCLCGRNARQSKPEHKQQQFDPDIYDKAGRNRIKQCCNIYGLDVKEMTGILTVAVHAGIVDAGDIQAACRLIHSTGQGTALGRIFGSGVESTARVLGVSMEDNKIINNSTQIVDTYKKLDDKWQTRFVDSTGLCLFAAAALLNNPARLNDLVVACNACYGWQKNLQDYLGVSEQRRSSR